MFQATFWTKKIEEKNFIFFSLFIGGTLMIFQEDFLWDFFMKNEKNLKFFSSIFFYRTCSLGHPKMSVRSFFEKSLTNFECVLFVLPRILTTSPFLINEILAIKNAILFFRNRLSRYVFNYRVLHVTLQEKKYIH